MSAVPRARTDEQQQDDPAGSAADPAAAADAEGWALLESLRRRLDEQANQHRKTQSDVRQLAESIGALVTQQRKRSWWMNVNSFVAYLMFTLLCGGASYFMYQSRAHELISERDRVISERDEAVQRADAEITKTTAREAADAKALEVYQLLQSGKRDEAAKKLAELAKAPLSKLDRTMLDERAKQVDLLQVESALKTAQAAFKAGHYADVIPMLEAALTLESKGQRAAQMHYYIGVSYAKTAALEPAATHLEAALAQDVEFEDARFHLASALDRAGQWGKAKVEYDRFATAHPMSPHAAFAMRRGGALSRFPAVRPANAPAAAESPAPKAPAAAPAPKPDAPAPAEQPAQPKTIDFNDPSTE